MAKQPNRRQPPSTWAGWQDRPAPYSEEAEEATLGAIQSAPHLYFTVARFLIGEDFYILRHQYIWEAIERIVQRGQSEWDYLTISKELQDMGRLDEIGGPGYLLRLVNNTPTSVHAELYARVVERAAERRRLMSASMELMALALNEEMSIEDVRQEGLSRIFGVLDDQSETNTITLRDEMLDYASRKEALMNTPGGLVGLSTGYDVLDKLTNGLQPGLMYVLAGRPSMGKSALALNILLSAAFPKNGGKPGRVIDQSGEMGIDSVIDRLIAAQTGLDLTHIVNPKLMDDEEWRKFEAAQRELHTPNIIIDDTPGITPMELRALCEREQRTRGLDLVIVDYMGLMRVPGLEPGSTAEMTEISRQIKSLARKLHVPVLALAQLSRAVEQRQDKRPTLSDLRQSGAIEQDADVVMFMYRDVYYNPTTDSPNQADVIVAKQRNGPTGIASLYFDDKSASFKGAIARHIDLSDASYVPEGDDD